MSEITVISSKNGLEATRHAYHALVSGSDGLSAVVEGVTLVEDDPADMTVGYGGLPNCNGEVELDAAAMHGPTHRVGGVAGLKGYRHAVRLAKLVLEQTKHALLVGDGAAEFARANGFPEENLLTETARQIWLYWKQTNSTREDWVPPPWETLAPEVQKFFAKMKPGTESTHNAYQRSEVVDRPTGTIHCSCIDGSGDLSCVTTTSGLAFKLPGRVGDSAIPGAGLYVDNEIGSCGSTGRGEENVRNCSSFAVVELMRSGLSPAEAGLEAMKRIANHVGEPYLLGDDGRPNFGLKFYVLAKSGEYAGVSMWGPTQFAVTDSQGTRYEDCEFLYAKP
ncbi:N(4)-(beta-N-acetylglucosaminyl)-L-asparaginase [Thalassoglobus sp. JC818]|uniref:N(4)-(beta-N-acetylglucosaminyl)-L-asparaginase n=1 Tax=Thalassoglobus sp. JC818 TaxID=3232136 RepID=UPI00345981BA